MIEYVQLNHPAFKGFMKVFERLAHRFQYSDVFDDFLDFCIYYLSLARVGSLDPLQEKYRDEFKMFLELFNLLGEGSEEFQDLLGTVYMEISSRSKSSRMGQYFTPDPVSMMMAELTLFDIDTERVGQKINDPSAGSGMMILKAASKFGNTRHLQFFVAQDLDLMCCKMCAINMSMNTIPGEVYHMNTLSLEYYGAYSLDLVIYEGKNMCLIRKWDTESIKALNEREARLRAEYAEFKKASIQEQMIADREKKDAEKLKAKDLKKGFTSTLFD
jgi:type I restriction-modification system DNA methylase subunit